MISSIELAVELGEILNKLSGIKSASSGLGTKHI